MINANELRLDNVISIDEKYYNILAINGLNRLNPTIRVFNGAKKKWHYCDCVNPIPLTQEWFERFGFEKVNPVQEYHKNAFEKQGWGRVSLLNGVLKSDEYYFLDGMTAEIKYVHQLQNLYFAMRGEVLIIKTN